MFPEDLSGLSPSIANIFSEGSFNNRDYLMISRCVDEGWFSEEPSEELSKNYHDDFMATLVKIMDYFRLK